MCDAQQGVPPGALAEVAVGEDHLHASIPFEVRRAAGHVIGRALVEDKDLPVRRQPAQRRGDAAVQVIGEFARGDAHRPRARGDLGAPVFELRARGDAPVEPRREPAVAAREEQASGGEIVDTPAVGPVAQRIGGGQVARDAGVTVFLDRAHHLLRRVEALARHRHEVETEHAVHRAERSEPIACAGRRVDDASLRHRERTRKVQVVVDVLGESPEPVTLRFCWRAVRRPLREIADALPQVVEPFGGLPKRREGEVHARAVVREEALIAERERIDAQRFELAHLGGVARGFRHLHAVGEEMLSMDPRADHAVRERAL